MGKALVIVESPAKAKTINKYLGNDYVVKSSVGHIRDLPTSGSASKKSAESTEDKTKDKAKRKSRKMKRPRWSIAWASILTTGGKRNMRFCPVRKKWSPS